MAVSFNRMAVLAAEAAEEQAAQANEEQSSLRKLAQRISNITPGFGNNTRSLFIFSEDNFIRKYAKMIIEWGYPFEVLLSIKCILFVSITVVALNLVACVVTSYINLSA